MKSRILLLRAALLMGLLSLSTSGCVFRTVAEQQKKMDALCQLWGSVRAEQGNGAPFVVVLARHRGGDLRQPESWSIFDHFVLEGPGRWFFAVSPGTYALAAFEDRNGDRVYQPGESAFRIAEDHLIQCQPGQAKRDIALVVPAGGSPRLNGSIDIRALEGRDIHDQMRLSLNALMAEGEVATLADARFARENARKGLWQPFDFLFDVRAGVYFLEPFDEAKTPVLFVHGIDGTPRDFDYLIGHLDRDRFQPWMVYYPSGARLDYVADFLDQIVTKLRVRLGFRRFFVVAHSMGGLVSRAFIFKHQATGGGEDMPVFVSISTPWGGHKAAALGVKRAPAVVRSWYDMAPDSAFLNGIFFDEPGEKTARRPLPKTVTHHLLFGFKGRDASDGTVSLASQLRQEAQDDAFAIRGFDATHTGILRMPEVSGLLNRILDDASHR